MNKILFAILLFSIFIAGCVDEIGERPVLVKSLKIKEQVIRQEQVVDFNKINTQEECERNVGKWSATGIFVNNPTFKCFPKLSDGGKSCIDSSECQGSCALIRDSNGTLLGLNGGRFKEYGRCSDYDTPYCDTMEKGKPQDLCAVI